MQRGVLEHLRAQPAEHTRAVLMPRPDGGNEWVDVTCPWPGYVAIEQIAADLIATPVTRAGLESVRRVVKRMAAQGQAELGWRSETVPVGEPRTWTWDGQEHTRQGEAVRCKLAARRPLTEAEAAAEAAHLAAEQARADERMEHFRAVLSGEAGAKR